MFACSLRAEKCAMRAKGHVLFLPIGRPDDDFVDSAVNPFAPSALSRFSTSIPFLHVLPPFSVCAKGKVRVQRRPMGLAAHVAHWLHLILSKCSRGKKRGWQSLAIHLAAPLPVKGGSLRRLPLACLHRDYKQTPTLELWLLLCGDGGQRRFTFWISEQDKVTFCFLGTAEQKVWQRSRAAKVIITKAPFCPPLPLPQPQRYV